MGRNGRYFILSTVGLHFDIFGIHLPELDTSQRYFISFTGKRPFDGACYDGASAMKHKFRTINITIYRPLIRPIADFVQLNPYHIPVSVFLFADEKHAMGMVLEPILQLKDDRLDRTGMFRIG